MKKVLITGSTGFIGRYCCKEILARGNDFLAIVRNTSKCEDDIRTVAVDLHDKNELIKVVERYKPDAVLHLAAIAAVTYGDISEIYSTNISATETLLETLYDTCISGTRVVLVSTAGVYGNQKEPYYFENMPFAPVNHYSYSKMVMEYISQQYTDKLDIKIVRPFNIVGYGQNMNFFLPKLVNAFASKQETIKLGNIGSERDYVNVEYCVNVLMELLTRSKVEIEKLNICSGIATSGVNIINMLKEISGYSPDIQISEGFVRRNEVWRLVGSNEELLKFLGDKEFKGDSVYKVLSKMYNSYCNE
ncbi:MULTISPECIES: NAD-dependent epimerase/dehydratase family protein [unclassified Lacrimispora]|uniref:NAD-dependent epimerase/dehydratase family protein n=1 Tax=unclassified Lacrimispora TaxID=2719232 RepID=UPI0037707803